MKDNTTKITLKNIITLLFIVSHLMAGYFLVMSFGMGILFILSKYGWKGGACFVVAMVVSYLHLTFKLSK